MLKKILHFISSSFHRKQITLILLINVICLGTASTLFFSNNLANYKERLSTDISSKAKLAGSSSASALMFDDVYSAQNILKTLEENSSLKYAAIFDTEYQLFADINFLPSPPEIDASKLKNGTRFNGDFIETFQAIHFDQELVGYILICGETSAIAEQAKDYALIIGAVFSLSLLLAIILSIYIQRVSLKPIRELAKLSSYVSNNQLYDRRLEISSRDEIGTLVTGFNNMLNTIEDREQQLKNHGEHLEHVVEQRTAELHHRANYDELTGLTNRYQLVDILIKGTRKARRSNSRQALLFLDLNRFKVINDNLGHAVGDKLLKGVAQRLTETLRDSDNTARWGGDEFVIYIDKFTHISHVENIAKKIISALQAPFQIAANNLHISTSIGISIYPDDAETPELLIKHADMSMYKAKEEGTGKYCFFSHDMRTESLQRLALEAQLRNAVTNQEFELYYQPKINTVTNNICGFEALLRWNHPEQGLVPPGDFIPVAEEIGIINNIGVWVMEQACQANARWQSQGLPALQVAVNLSASHLRDISLPDTIADILKDSDLPAHCLEIEITENLLLEISAQTLRSLQTLRSIGINIAIDDFGTGYSCLSYLRDLPIDTLKIDGSFIHHLGKEKSNDGIVKAIINMGHSLGQEIVAECVETEDQLALLKDMNCDIIQGYYYSKPLPESLVSHFIQKHSQQNASYD